MKVARSLSRNMETKLQLLSLVKVVKCNWPAAGIQNFDKENLPSRIAARGGLGAVMGSKKIKAIVIDAKDGQKPPLHILKNFV